MSKKEQQTRRTCLKKFLFIIIMTNLIAAGITACKSKAPETSETKTAQTNVSAAPSPATPGNQPTMPLAQPPGPGMGMQAGTGMSATAGNKTGKVVETMSSGGYTYVQVDTGTEKFWAAAPQFEVKVGEKVTVPAGMPMINFKSNSLNRTFSLIYFVQAIGKGDQVPFMASSSGSIPGMGQSMPPQHPRVEVGKVTRDANISFAGIQKPAGGKTVDEIFAEQASLAGKEVTLRGKVVKFNPMIMGKNWVHVQDGTGKEGTNDLTVTTNSTAKVGDTVLLKGTVATNKDFGMGYKYKVIIENAKVTVE
jgi:hypothetical protein